MNEGWVCPRCKKVNAPDVKGCSCKSDDKSDDKSDFEELKKYIDDPKPERIGYPNYPYWYPDWVYGPYRPNTPYWFIYTTTTGDIIGL